MFSLRRLITSCLLFIALSSNAYALSSNGSDGAFIVGGEVTLNVTDGKVYNFTTIDINSGGVLNLYGTSPNSSFSMLASDDITIAGLVNVYTNTSIESAGNISITDRIDLKNQSSVSFSSLTLTSADVSNYGSSVTPNNSGIIILNTSPLKRDISLVPEPESYALLLSGLALITLARRRKQVKKLQSFAG